MTNGNHISEDDLVLFALQFLPEDRTREVLEHIKSCEACRTQLAQLQGDLAAYAMTAGATVPPAEARERLMRQVAKEPRLAPIPEPKPVPVVSERPSAEPRRGGEPVFAARQSRILPVETPDEKVERRPSKAPWVLAWTGWAVAAGCSFVAGLQLHQRQQMQGTMAAQEARLEQTTQTAARAQDALATLTAANAQQVALHLAPATLPKKGEAAAPVTPEALAAYIADKGALVFVATHMEPVGSGKTYELWLLPADPNKSPIPAGTFRPDAQGSASVVMPALPKGVAAKGFGVTIENAGGSTTPTLPIVMSGT